MNTTSLKQQSGVVLVISLIMLLLLTLIAISGSQTTGLQEKMASNSRDQNLAFQAAESALRAAEKELGTINSVTELNTQFNGSQAWLLKKETPEPPLFTGAKVTWTDNDSQQFQSGITEINTQPRYYIKHVGREKGDEINLIHYNETGSMEVHYFTITARGTGTQDTSQSYLKMQYAKQLVRG
jgi:type IV pilus assembly protein PilX